MKTETKRPRGRPVVPKDKRHTSYTISVPKEIADVFDNYVAKLDTIKTHKRKSHLFGQIARWLVASHFNPKA